MKFWITVFLFYRASIVIGTPILGGVDAEYRQYKYQVSLRELMFNDRYCQHYCGGSIISNSWILTAAHCVDNSRIEKDIRRIQIVAGITYLSDVGDKYYVKSCAIHEHWNKKRICNDIAVLETTRKIKFSSAVKPIPLATHNPPDNTITTLTGWGYISDDVGLDTVPIAYTLQVAHFETISLQDCRKQFNDAKYPGRLVIQSNICIAQPVATGQCSGDSGAALTVNGTQIGIVSFGGQCGEGLPGVLASVAVFLNWIKEKTLS
ncbi:hypothetical protein HA402_013285 [Bradysia odoriphaga]|nr:hypothetical protein HA402_013285 [Bradysia odoriphaga]